MALGILGSFLYIIGGFFRSPGTTMICSMMGGLVYIAYYLGLDLHAPIISIGIGLIATICARFCTHEKIVNLVCYVVGGTICAMIILNLTSAYDILLIFGQIALISAQIKRDNYIFYKSLMIVCNTFWIFYCIPHGDWAMTATCALLSGSHCISLTRNMIKDGLINLPSCKKNIRADHILK